MAACGSSSSSFYCAAAEVPVTTVADAVVTTTIAAANNLIKAKASLDSEAFALYLENTEIKYQCCENDGNHRKKLDKNVY